METDEKECFIIWSLRNEFDRECRPPRSIALLLDGLLILSGGNGGRPVREHAFSTSSSSSSSSRSSVVDTSTKSIAFGCGNADEVPLSMLLSTSSNTLAHCGAVASANIELE